MLSQLYDCTNKGESKNQSLDYEQIYIEYKDRVSGYIFSHISNSDDTRDLVSSVFTKILQSSASYRGDPNSISSFIYRITQNLVIDYYRTKKIQDEVSESLVASQSIEDDFFKQSTLDFLADALALLPDFERDIVILHYYKNISLKKIAIKLQSTDGKVKLAHSRAIKFLKNKFEEFDF